MKTLSLSPEKKALLDQRLGVAAQKHVKSPVIPRRQNQDPTPLSFAQRQMWVIDRMTPGNPAYNVPVGYRIKGALDVTALEDSVNEIIKRHEVLRTTFAVKDGDPLQLIHPALTINITVTELDHLSGEEREDKLQALASEESVRSFDLSRLPLIRVSLFKLGEAENVVIINLHHIVADGLSIGLMLDELDTFYRAFTCGGDPRPPDLAVQYADFAQWQRQTLANEAAYANQIEFWRKQLAGGLPVLELPGDMPRPALQSFKGSNVFFNIPTSLAEDLRLLGAHEACTFFMTLLAAFQVLLQRYSGADDMVIGTPVAARTPRELEPLIGNFLNMAALRCDLSGNPTFIELLQRTRDTTLNAFSNSDLPFEPMMKHLKFERDPSRNPIFQVVLQVLPTTAPKIGDLEISSFHFDLKFAQFDLSLHFYEDVGGYRGRFEYCTDLFHAETVERLSLNFVQLLHAIAGNPDQNIAALPLLTDAERQRLLVDWNDTAAPYPTREVCLHQLVEEQAGRTPDRIAVVFEQQALTYRELNCRANRLARHLRTLGVGPDVLVGLFVERSLEMLVGIVSILKAGGAYVPMDPGYPKERLGYILEDSGAPIVLTQESLVGELPPFAGQSICLDADWTAIACESEEDLPAAVKPEHLAYVLFTSGSTGRPKGVALEHRSAVTFVQWAKQVFTPQELAAVLFTTSVCFDLSVFEMFVALSTGGRIIVARNALHLPTLPEKDEVTLINTVPSAIAELLRVGAVPASVKTVNLAGEALSDTLVEQIYATTNVDKVYNLYGPTETTTYSTYTLVPRGWPVTIGRPIAGTQTYILDAHRNPVPIGVKGELYLAGGGLARGYYGRPELTMERFVPNPFSEEGEGRMYRTGDLCRWLPDGNIQYVGRTDHQVKLRGFRIELGEIESTLDQHPAVCQSVVLVREEEPGRKQLVAYVVPEPAAAAPQIQELRHYVKERLPDFMVPTAVVLLDAFPLTPNGKIDRKALPAPSYENLQTAQDFIRPHTETERGLAAIWTEVLKVEHVGIHDDFFDLGGHSLLAIMAVSRIRDVFEVDLPTRTLFGNPTIAELAKVLTAAKGAGGHVPRIERRSQSGPCALSFAQERFWLLHQLAPSSPVYNVVDVIHVEGTYDAAAMSRALKELVRRHDVLRTAVDHRHGQPMQIVMPTIDLALSELDLGAVSEPERERAWIRVVHEEGRKPFDLSQAPPLRGTVMHLSPCEHRLLLTTHHIIADEWSMEVIHQEITQLYEAFSQGQPSPLPELPIQYADFACWQRSWLQGDVRQRQLAYWKDVLAGAPSMLDLPTDKPRPAIQSFRGATESFALPKELLERLTALGRQEQATLFMILEASFMALLHRYTGQDDLLVGIPISGRTHSETERLIGCFINTVVLRAQLTDSLTFRGLLHQVRERALGAYAHPDLPFEQLVAALAPERDPSRTPLFQVMFVLHNSEGVSQVSKVSGNRQLETGTSKFDLSLFISETADGLEGIFEYCTDLFEAQTIRRLCGHYGALLHAIVRDPDQKISTLPMLTDAERHQVLVEWNQTAVAYPAARCVHEMVEEQARIRPDALAAESGGRQLSYRGLDERAESLAGRLRNHGVQADSLVAIYLERSIEMLVGLLAVWKAGAAYVPIDPEYPAERVRFMLEDTKAVIVLTQKSLSGALPVTDTAVVHLDAEEDRVATSSGGRAQRSSWSAEKLAYVIYTSGSTGPPKGVPIKHTSLFNLICWHQQAYEVRPADRATQIAGSAFDASVWEIWPYLTAGASVHIPDDTTRLDGGKLVRWLADRQITLTFLPTPLAESALRESWPQTAALRVLLTGGDKLNQRPARKLPFRVVNHYGPTENTVVSTCAEVEEGISNAAPPIGRPLPNTQAYVLDRHLQPVPIGVPGELLLGGLQLTSGYWNRPELTAEKFIPNPFRAEPGARLYKTGDLVRLLPDGNIEFLGRIDNQVKIRGFRIELGEIESVLAQHPGVQEAVVLAREDSPGDKRLVGYVVSISQEPSISKLKNYLKEKLPEYMVPSAFVFLEALPLTPNGKVERRALPAPEQSRPEIGASYVAPRTPVEEVLANIWAEVLNVERVGIYDNFFDLGGHSLLAVRVVQSIEKRIGRSVRVADIFQAPTVEQLSGLLPKNEPAAPWSSLVPLQTKGFKPPFFWVHGDISDAYLPRYLDAEQPLYGLNHQSTDGQRALYTTVEDIATHYLEEILTVQRRGTYRLGGNCFGGLVAFEMARQLQERGQKVDLLMLLNPACREPGHSSNPSSGKSFLRNNVPRCVQAFQSARHQDALYLIKGFKNLIAYEVSSVIGAGKRLIQKVVYKTYLRLGFPIPVSLRSRYILEIYARATESYTVKAYSGDMVLFFAHDYPQHLRMDWSKRSTGSVRMHNVPGDHVGALDDINVKVWAERLASYLESLEDGQTQESCRINSGFSE